MSSSYSKDEEELRSSKMRFNSSDSNASPAVIKIKRESNNVANSPTKNNQTPIQQLLQEPL
jgi:hypothetical protein